MAQLIVYFSRRGENYVSGRIQPLSVGNTEVVARRLQVLTGADLFQLEPVHPYSDNYNLCIEQAQADQQAMELLRRVGLEDKADSYPNQLSGGQKQRIAIVRALAMKPKLMLFDEPTSALDPELTGEVLRVIRELAEQRTTMIIVTHEMAFARDVADQVIFMDGGVIVEQGDAHQVIEHPREERTRQFLARYSEG